VSSPTPLQFGTSQNPGSTIYSNSISECLDSGDIGWHFSILPDLDWDKVTYSGTDASIFVGSSSAGMEEQTSMAFPESPEYEAISHPPNPSALKTATVPSQVLPGHGLPAATQRLDGEEVSGRADSPVGVTNVPETVALPQLEKSSAAGSFTYGSGGGGGGGSGGGGGGWESDPSYGFDEYINYSDSDETRPPQRRNPMGKPTGREATCASHKSHRFLSNKNEMDRLTSMMQSARIQDSRGSRSSMQSARRSLWLTK
jgi:hypothetical protein